MLQSAGPSGVNATTSTNASTNFTAPSSITVGSLTSTFDYAADLLPTQATGPNGDSTSTVYDSYARPKSSTAKTGAVTYFAYGTNQTLAYTNPTGNAVGRVSRVKLDGFGRAVKQEAGTGTYSSGSGAITLSTIVSTVDTQYAPCGCSPLGKLSQRSRPYAPGGSVYWTVYTYDGIGRTTSVIPDRASTTSYLYTGEDVKVTDAAGKWKKFTTDAAGNLTQVVEPDPLNLPNGTLPTYYTYDVLNQLRTVSITRAGTTQKRTFTYGSYIATNLSILAVNGVGPFLMSAANPENGTVSNTYNSDSTLAYKIDAKGQKIGYSYDSPMHRRDPRRTRNTPQYTYSSEGKIPLVILRRPPMIAMAELW